MRYLYIFRSCRHIKWQMSTYSFYFWKALCLNRRFTMLSFCDVTSGQSCCSWAMVHTNEAFQFQLHTRKRHLRGKWGGTFRWPLWPLGSGRVNILHSRRLTPAGREWDCLHCWAQELGSSNVKYECRNQSYFSPSVFHSVDIVTVNFWGQM